MRLHHLRLEAFGPFAAPQQVDFDRLGASGLFLLEGPTGAGKTTILDAVTFALYGALSGRDCADRQHSHFADPAVEPSVELEFSVRGVRHRIRRTPEWQRPKKRGGGFTMQAASVHLQRCEAGAWQSLSAGKAEVGALMTDLLGLNRDQFGQVVLLPQGDFARFLRASDDERRVLLTKIFGTDLYDEITAELSRRRVAAQRDVDAARARRSDRVSAAAEAACLSSDDRDALVAADEATQRARFTQLRAELAESAADAATVAAARAVALLTAREEHGQAKRTVELATRKRAAQAALRAHGQTERSHLDEEAALRAARRASAVRPLMLLADEAARATTGIRRAVRALAPDSPELPDGLGAGELLAAATRMTREADALTAGVDLERQLPARLDQLTEAEIRSDSAAKHLDQLEDRQAELPELVRRARNELDAAREATNRLAAMRTQELLLRARAEAATAVAEVARLAEAKQAERAVAVDTQQRMVDAHQRALESRLNGMAAELAGQLRAGEPCSVCGSPAHPVPARPGADAVSAADVEVALHARRQAEAARERVETGWADLKERLAGHRSAADDQPLSTLSAQLDRLRSGLAEAAAIAAGLPGAEATLTEREVEQDRLHTALQQAGADLAGSSAQTTAIAAELAGAEATVAAARGDFPSVAERQADLRARGETAAALADAVADLARGLSTHSAAVERAERAAATAGFTDLDAARAVMRDDDAVDALEAAVQEWQRTAERLRAAATAAEFDGIDLAQLDEYTAAADRSKTRLGQAQEAEQAAKKAADAGARVCERFTQRLDDFEAAARAVQAATRAGEDVIHLANLARGMDGHRRVNLTTYVLRHWFDKVVDAANTRLVDMSSGRYTLVRTDEGSRANERSGLTLRVVDQHTGEERGTTSMSGGETFYTSLALALGLADIVTAQAGGVELDTLFIDEGFGSLDGETLDQVMGVIDELRDNGRVIGIVSHVADLKDRVHERVEVRRQRGGASTLTIVA